MRQLNNSLDEIKNNLYLVLENLDDINDENFNDKMCNVNSLIHKIEEKRTFIRENYNPDSLIGKSDMFHIAIKQIRAKFDDIIEEKKNEQNKISSELNKLVNKKKLINYQR